MFGLKVEIYTSVRHIPQLIETKQDEEAECVLGCVLHQVGRPSANGPVLIQVVLGCMFKF